jgi:transcriptional regulator with XRE-family HTH domain
MEDLVLTVRGRRLVKEVRKMRSASGLKLEQAARRLGISGSTLWRMEVGKSRIPLEVLAAMLDLYDVDQTRRDTVEKLAFEAARRGWWSNYGDTFSGSYVALESDASALRVNAMLVPSLFQTPDYTRACAARTSTTADGADVERLVAAQRDRRRALFEERDTPPDTRVVIDEGALRRRVGDVDVLRAQLEFLLDVSAWPGVSLRVLSFEQGAHAGVDGQFAIVDFPDADDDPFVYQAGLFGDLYLEAPEEVERYTRAFAQLSELALPDDASRELITRLAKA